VWFERLTGFSESDAGGVLARIREDGPYLESAANGRRMRRGEFSMPSLAQLRQWRDRAPRHGATTVAEVVADVRDLHADPAAAGATFQVASQFNMLEMTSPRVTPEDGVDRYELDPTQGPACSIACGAGTIHRNYLVPFGQGATGARGQTVDRQLDGFADLAAALDLRAEMRNGYAFLTEEQLASAGWRLSQARGSELDELAGLLRVGVQAGTEVTWQDAGHTVTQVFCSALPIAYVGGRTGSWEPLARLVLDAAYEATLAAAVLAAAASGNRTVYLTLVGAGAFGNPVSWVVDALLRAVRLHGDAGLDVRVVSYGRPQPELRALTAATLSWADRLFDDQPARWGLRGDPYLWQDLHTALRGYRQAPASRAELARILTRQLRDLAGLDLSDPDDGPVRVPRYPTSGMTGGFVAPAFWRDVAVPLLLERWDPRQG
jgi:hypothetical protein